MNCTLACLPVFPRRDEAPQSHVREARARRHSAKKKRSALIACSTAGCLRTRGIPSKKANSLILLPADAERMSSETIPTDFCPARFVNYHCINLEEHRLNKENIVNWHKTTRRQQPSSFSSRSMCRSFLDPLRKLSAAKVFLHCFRDWSTFDHVMTSSRADM